MNAAYLIIAGIIIFFLIIIFFILTILPKSTTYYCAKCNKKLKTTNIKYKRVDDLKNILICQEYSCKKCKAHWEQSELIIPK